MAGTDILRTSVGDFPLLEYRLPLGDRQWSILHTGAILTHADELRFLDARDARPYGVVLWPAAIALAHDLAARGTALAGLRVLELGAGTGLPGIVAAAHGARVLQTDRQEVAISVCRKNAERNGVTTIEHRSLDWLASDLVDEYDLIIGSDIAYAPRLHPALRALFASHLATGGRVLVADPFRAAALPLFEEMGADGWSVTLSKWTVEVGSEARPVGVFELAPPRHDRALTVPR